MYNNKRKTENAYANLQFYYDVGETLRAWHSKKKKNTGGADVYVLSRNLTLGRWLAFDFRYFNTNKLNSV